MDLVVDAEADQLDRLVQGLRGRDLYANETAAREALETRGQFNVIDPETGWKVDLIIRKDRLFSLQEFSRRQPATVMGATVALTSLEDLILVKLEWSRTGESELQRRDVLQLVEAGWDTLDRDYVRTWAAELGFQAEWDRILAEVSASREQDPD